MFDKRMNRCLTEKSFKNVYICGERVNLNILEVCVLTAGWGKHVEDVHMHMLICICRFTHAYVALHMHM